MPHFDQAELAREEAQLAGLRRVEICLTEMCNLSCDYCNIAHNLQAPLKKPMTPELIDSIVEFVARQADPTGIEVVFTGGEPLTFWPAFTQAVEEIGAGLQPLPIAIHLTTNGTLLRADRPQWLADHGVQVTVGIDGRQETHDSNRTNPAGVGSWRRSTKGLVALAEAGIQPDLSVVVTNDTIVEAADEIDWLCETYEPGTIELNMAAPATLDEPNQRPEPEAWADLLSATHLKWGDRTRIQPVARMAEALAGQPILHSDDGAWGGSICVGVRGQAAPSLALLCAGVGQVELGSADLNAGPFQQWRDRSPARNPDCAECPALGLCGNTSMYASTTYAGSPDARDPWHCRTQVRLVENLLAIHA